MPTHATAIRMGGRGIHRNIHIAATGMALVALPWSEFLLSNAELILLFNWLWAGVAERDLRGRFKRALTTAESAVFLSFFALHVLGLAWTTDLDWGLTLCRILLPVLLFGLVFPSVPRFTAKQLKTFLLLGAWSATASTLISLAMRYDIWSQGAYRELSPFISHIRLALLLCMALTVFVYYWPRKPWKRIAHVLAILWVLVFINLMSTLIALPVLVALTLFGLYRLTRRWGAIPRLAVAATVAVGLVGGAFSLWNAATQQHRADPSGLSGLARYSAGGEEYYHNIKDPQVENGHYVWIYVADKELERTWERRSAIPFAGKDAKGQPLRSTLVRYLASMGQRKDSTGVMALTDADVARIEQGSTSVVADNKSTMATRVDEVMYELDRYRKVGDPNGHSVTMRLEFIRAGLDIIKHDWLVGVGTGDTQLAFDEAFDRIDTKLDPRWRLRAHNQFLTLFISFGVFGFLWSLFSWWWPAWRNQAFRQPLFVAWAIIFLLSCLSEDTIETQPGATFFALYYALFVFAAPRSSESMS